MFRILVSWSLFSLEASPSCSLDHLELREEGREAIMDHLERREEGREATRDHLELREEGREVTRLCGHHHNTSG